MLGRFKETSPLGPDFSSQSKSLIWRAIFCPINSDAKGMMRWSVGLKKPS